MNARKSRKIRKEARKFMSEQWQKVNALPWHNCLVLAFCILFGFVPDAWRLLR